MPRAALILIALVAVAAGAFFVLRDDAPDDRIRGAFVTEEVPRLEAWEHVADPEDAGLDAGWAQRPPAMEPVEVPGVPAAQVVGGEAGFRSFEGSVGWWRAQLIVDEPGRYAVRFGSVGHRATGWIDGQQACEHVGAYEPFDCVAQLEPGTHTVMLRADWQNPGGQARAGHDRAWWNWGGPSWPVSVRQLRDADLDVVDVDTRLLAGGAARVTLTVRVTDVRGRSDAEPLRPTLAGFLATEGDAEPLRLQAPEVTVPAGGERRVRLTADVADPALWSPADPQTYTLTLLGDEGADAFLQRHVGLRELRRDGPRLLLNGQPLRLLGVGLPPDARGHGDSLTANDRAEIIEEIKATGANTVRSQHPLSDEFLDELDAAGILVWQLVGPFDKAGKFWAQTPEKAERARARILRDVDRMAAHPSVVAWSLTNELAGQGHPAGQAAFLSEVAQTLQRRTRGILVATDVWGSHLPREAGGAYEHLDAVGFTEYVGNAELLDAPVAEQDAEATRRVDQLRTLFPGKAVVVTEFGANGNAQNPTDGPGGFGYQADLLRRRIALYAARPDVAGMLVWTLRDYAVSPGFSGGSLGERQPQLKLSGPLSEKGLFRYDGSPKPAVAAVRQAFDAVKPGS